MLDPILSRARQKRLLAAMQERKLDAVVLALPYHVYYFSAFHPFWLHQSAFVLFSDGRSWLTSGGGDPPERAAVDDPMTFESNWLGTIRQEQPLIVAGQVIEVLKSR